MKTSTIGIDLIKSFEGYRNKAYQDSVGVWTIGWGTTKINGKAVTKGMTCTEAQATEYMKADLVKFENNVSKFSYTWNQNEFDALVSFAYNIGSIDQLTANGTRTKAKIAEMIPAYNKAGGKVLNGLVRRRAKEQELFLKPIDEESEGWIEGNDYWVVGNVYEVITTNGVKIRSEPDINSDAAVMITANAKRVAKYSNGFYVLPKGTRVTCKSITRQIQSVQTLVWMQIPSGYICCMENGTAYVG